MLLSHRISVPSAAEGTDDHPEGIRARAIFNGAVHVAVIDELVTGSAVRGSGCGLTAAGARAAASEQFSVHCELRQPPPDPQVARTAERLEPADFAPDAHRIEARPPVPAHGTVSDLWYEVPAGVVLGAEAQHSSSAVAEPATLGARWSGGGQDSISAGIADVMARDVVGRWWRRPRPAVSKLTERLPALLPPSALRSLHSSGLEVEGFRWSAEGAQIVLIAVTRHGRKDATFGVAAATAPQAAARTALCRTLHTRAALSWPRYPDHPSGATAARVLTGWHQGSDQLAMLDHYAALDPHPADPREEAGSAGSRPIAWADSATKRFGHEPVVVSWPERRSGRVTKVLCPGAAVYRAAVEQLPCPVW